MCGRYRRTTQEEELARLYHIPIPSQIVHSFFKHDNRRVLFIASEAAISPSPEMAHYSATKTMQLSLSRSLAELTKGTAVTVNTVMPGSTKTEGIAKLVQEIFPGVSLEEGSSSPNNGARDARSMVKHS
jgi:short-subunit dehydrogenase